MISIYQASLIVMAVPALCAMVVGIGSGVVGRKAAHSITIAGVAIAFILSIWVLQKMLSGQAPVDTMIYTWASGGHLFPYTFQFGMLIDPLSAVMMVVVTFVSLLVHFYSIGYMHDDPGYQRFFSYISLFTSSMLVLVLGNNFLQLFLGWEAVGLASYLLIGFWFTKESALQGSLKAFLVNRVGDFGFLLGIALLMAYTGTLHYADIFSQMPKLTQIEIPIFGYSCSLITTVALLLFVGAMGKSAQVPLHVWLPESMEGPTPISALIHAATMVTAGVFMVSRMSPLYEFSETALSVIMIIGASGALWLGLIALVVTDIKRVVAYSTLSQLGYMMVAAGASAYSVAMFHLLTHACFKALLFLGAGSVIIAMHHEQDMRRMGGLARYMPITYATVLIGSLALCAIPPLSGFYSKDFVIEAVSLSQLSGAGYAYWCVALGAFVTACYTFRAFFMTFHGEPRMDAETKSHLKESPWVVWLPLVILAIPSVLLGLWMVTPILFAKPALLGNAIFVLPEHDVMAELSHHYHGAWSAVLHGMTALPFWLTLLGIATATWAYVLQPSLPEKMAGRFQIIYQILIHKYGFDAFNDRVFVQGTHSLGKWLSRVTDNALIDAALVDGTGKTVYGVSSVVRRLQSGYLFHYISFMVAGVFILLIWLLIG